MKVVMRKREKAQSDSQSSLPTPITPVAFDIHHSGLKRKGQKLPMSSVTEDSIVPSSSFDYISPATDCASDTSSTDCGTTEEGKSTLRIRSDESFSTVSRSGSSTFKTPSSAAELNNARSIVSVPSKIETSTYDSVGLGSTTSTKRQKVNKSKTSAPSSSAASSGRLSPVLTPHVGSLASDEANIARLLAELSGHDLDLSSPKGSRGLSRGLVRISGKGGTFSPSSENTESFTAKGNSNLDGESEDSESVPSPATMSRVSSVSDTISRLLTTSHHLSPRFPLTAFHYPKGVSIGNVLVSLGRVRSNSAECLSTAALDRSMVRPRADSVGQLGIYSLAQRRAKIERYVEKRKHRVWSKKIKYDVRKNFADSRVRVKGRFVRKEDEANGTKTSKVSVISEKDAAAIAEDV